MYMQYNVTLVVCNAVELLPNVTSEIDMRPVILYKKYLVLVAYHSDISRSKICLLNRRIAEY